MSPAKRTAKLADYWIDDDGCLAHGFGDTYRTMAEFADASEDERTRILEALNAHDTLTAERDRLKAALVSLRDRLQNMDSMSGHDLDEMDRIARAALAGKDGQ